MRTTTSLLLAIVLLASCNQFEKAPSGMTYKITSGGTKEKVKQGQFLKLHIEYKLKSTFEPRVYFKALSTWGIIPTYKSTCWDKKLMDTKCQTVCLYFTLLYHTVQYSNCAFWLIFCELLGLSIPDIFSP